MEDTSPLNHPPEELPELLEVFPLDELLALVDPLDILPLVPENPLLFTVVPPFAVLAGLLVLLAPLVLPAGACTDGAAPVHASIVAGVLLAAAAAAALAAALNWLASMFLYLL